MLKFRRIFRYLFEFGVILYEERNCDRKYCENNFCVEFFLVFFGEFELKKYGGKIRGRFKRYVFI